jgi:hypothetical protein
VEALVRALGFGPRADADEPDPAVAEVAADRSATRQGILERLANHEIDAEAAAAALRSLGRSR